ncbi:unnamed protein product, partial [Mesorhabditis belari]|uniref:Protein kinase domain-containing protein n=1 Tax=Mesorhabditis belari TaxID=2138241 RepID=A0AAF3ETY7_9BILA
MPSLSELIEAKKGANAALRAANASKSCEGDEILAIEASHLNDEHHSSIVQSNSYLIDSTYDSLHSSAGNFSRSIIEPKNKSSISHKAHDVIVEERTDIDNVENKKSNISLPAPAKQNISRCLSDTRIKVKDRNRANESRGAIERSTSLYQFIDVNELLTINGQLFRKDNIVGKGGSSVVWSAANMATKQEVAIKIVSLNEDHGVIEAYTNEIAILEELKDCRRVIHLFDHEFMYEQQLLYIVLEKGATDFGTFIKERHRSKAINATFIHFYWEEMLLCVQTIHEKGIIHKDLKPANFLLVGGDLKLIDFGISTQMPKNQDSLQSSVILGTPSYMAPEMLQSTGETTAKVDVWSLGCILYAIVYGRTPFQKYRVTSEKIKAICNPKVEIDFPPHHDSLLVETMKWCLVRDPRRRASIKELLEHPFCDSRRKQPSASDSSALVDFAADLLSKTPNSRQRALETLCRRFESTSLSTPQLDL